MHFYTQQHGDALVRAARSAIELSLVSPRFDINAIRRELSVFTQQHGLMVRLRHYPTDELRGEFGVLQHNSTIGELLVEHALSAAFRSAKHLPITASEMGRLIVEVCVTTKPELVRSPAKRKAIKPAAEGIILEYGTHTAVVMPEQAQHNNWNAQHMLEHACIQAGLDKNHWLQPNLKIYKFEVQIFREAAPNGEVVEVIKGP